MVSEAKDMNNGHVDKGEKFGDDNSTIVSRLCFKLLLILGKYVVYILILVVVCLGEVNSAVARLLLEAPTHSPKAALALTFSLHTVPWSWAILTCLRIKQYDGTI